MTSVAPVEPHSLLPGLGAEATLLFIHAHPDDETIVTGATMAAYVAAGARVVLLTNTRGELGEVIPVELGHLEVNRHKRFPDEIPASIPADGLALGVVRELELADALAALGVKEHIWLGQGISAPVTGETSFRDSGMKWGPDGRAAAADTVLEDSFSRVSLDVTAQLAAAVIAELQPDAVISYASDGGYGHPDHVRTHQLTQAAVALAVEAGARTPRVFAIVSDRPERPLDSGVERLQVAGDVVAKTAAMRAHRTQMIVEGTKFALSDEVWRPIEGVEEFVELSARVQAEGSNQSA